MATSIGKLSKSFFLKLLVGIIILPFVFWGMGDVFRGGNQNVVATIESKKISTQEFVNYLRRLNLDDEQIKNLPKTDLIDFDNATADKIGTNVELETSNFGWIIIENEIPPFGDVHFLSNRPLPVVCFSAMIIAPFSFLSDAICCAKFCVESISSK